MLHQAQRTGLPSLQGLPAPTMRNAVACQVCRACQRLPCATPWPAKSAKVCQSLPKSAKPVKTGQSRPSHTYYFRNSGIFTIFVV